MRAEARCSLLAAWTLAALAGSGNAQQPGTDARVPDAIPADLAQLRSTLVALIEDPALARAHVGLAVVAAGSGEVLFRHNAERRFTAASTTKLVTTAVALDRLGAEHRWETAVLASGALRDDVLEGDLWIRGGGDPVLRQETLEAMARSVRQAGIRRVTGDLVGDDRAFAGPPWGRGWMWDDLYGSYAAGVSALQLSPARVSAELLPGVRLGAPAILRILEPGTELPIRNEVLTGAPGSELRLGYLPDRTGGDVALSGWIPLDEDRVPLGFAPPHPTAHFLERLALSLARAGVEVDGGPRRAGALEEPRAPAWERSFRSAPLAEALDRTLKASDNQVAETLLRTLGTLDGDGSDEAGLEEIRSTLVSWGIEPDAYRLADGSGMSRYNEITPAALVRLLRRVSQLPDSRIFLDALPIAAVDGTLSLRFRSTAASGEVRAKTGSLSGVRALAGFARDGDGETLVFALLLNGYDAPDGVATALEDLLVEQLTLYHGPTYPEGRIRGR